MNLNDPNNQQQQQQQQPPPGQQLPPAGAGPGAQQVDPMAALAQAMNNQAAMLQQLLQPPGAAAAGQPLGAGPAGRARPMKLVTLSEADPVKWIWWRRNFEIVNRNNQWGDAEARRQVGAAMCGHAYDAVATIPLGDVPLPGFMVAPVEELLIQYQDRFITPAAGIAARTELQMAMQMEDESLLLWHQRLLRLYQRAYPEATPAQCAASPDLREKFMKCIYDSRVGKKTYEASPQSYDEALAEAHLAFNSVTTWNDGRQLNLMGSIRPSASGGRRAATKDDLCNFCGIPGHFASECRKKAASLAGGAPPPYRGGRGGRGSSGRGGRGQGRGSGGSGRGGGQPHRAGSSNRSSSGSAGYSKPRQPGRGRGRPASGSGRRINALTASEGSDPVVPADSYTTEDLSDGDTELANLLGSHTASGN